jgi:hypothetical protein
VASAKQAHDLRAIERAQQRAARLGVQTFAREPGRMRFAESREFCLARHSKIPERRPLCHCGLRMPDPRDAAWSGWADSYGHRNPAGEPCKSFSMEEKLNYVRDWKRQPNEQEIRMSEVSSEEPIANTNAEPARAPRKRTAKPKAKLMDRAEQRARRERFMREYPIDRDAVAAARRAGFEGQYAARVARELVRQYEAQAAAPSERVASPQAQRALVEVIQVDRSGRITMGDLNALPANVSIAIDSNGVRVSVLGAA